MKYKEFWIADYVIGQAVTDDAKIRSSFDKPGDLREIHVIEYQALLDEAEAHKAAAAVLQKEIEKLQKQNEKLKETLDYYTSPEVAKKLPIVEGFDYDEAIGEMARKTLKEIENL